jgi:hypothetical protein
MNILPLDKQIEIIAALCEGVGQRAVSRLTDTDRKTVARLAFNVGRGAAELHDRMMVGLRVHRIECDELWAYVGHKRNPQKGPPRRSPAFGDQYTYRSSLDNVVERAAMRTFKKRLTRGRNVRRFAPHSHGTPPRCCNTDDTSSVDLGQSDFGRDQSRRAYFKVPRAVLVERHARDRGNYQRLVDATAPVAMLARHPAAGALARIGPLARSCARGL